MPKLHQVHHRVQSELHQIQHQISHHRQVQHNVPELHKVQHRVQSELNQVQHELGHHHQVQHQNQASLQLQVQPQHQSELHRVQTQHQPALHHKVQPQHLPGLHLQVTAEELVTALRELFYTYEVPQQLTSNGGTTYLVDYTQRFLQRWGVQHRVSISYNPHANTDLLAKSRPLKPLEVGNTVQVQNQQHHHPIERKLLAVTWGLQKTGYYTLGCTKLHILVDHKPLLGLLKSRNLGETENPRLLHLPERLSRWKFDIQQIARGQNFAPDTQPGPHCRRA